MDRTAERRLMLAGLGLAGAAAIARFAKAGPIDPPPGPVSSTGKTLREVYDKIARDDVGTPEPRKPVQGCPSSPTAQYVISQPGAYYLTGNITGEPGKCAIEIQCDHVDLDCGGFTFQGVQGTRQCIFGIGRKGIVIDDGTFRSWSGGVPCDLDGSVACMVSDCLFDSCDCPDDPATGQVGAMCRMGSSCEMCDCDFVDCTGSSVGCTFRCVIESCTWNGGSGGGVRCLDGCCVEDCCVEQNQGLAIQCGSHCCIGDNKAVLCWGMSCHAGCAVYDNELTLCNSPTGDAALSIDGEECCVEDNLCVECRVGIQIRSSGSWSEVSNNRVTGGGGGAGGGAGIVIDAAAIGVLCVCNTVRAGGPGVIPYMMGSASHGPIVFLPPGDMSGIPNADHPWANFAS